MKDLAHHTGKRRDRGQLSELKDKALTGEAALAALEAQNRTFAYPAEVAAVFEKDTKTIYAALERGEIPHVRIGQRFHTPVAWLRRAVSGTAA